MTDQSFDIKACTIALICALPVEFAAAVAVLDERRYPSLPQHELNDNQYAFGQVGHHNIVIACYPFIRYGQKGVIKVIVNLCRSFPSIKLGLLVGIGGGAPLLPQHDIRLGDVVVGDPIAGFGGVMQYHYGKTNQFVLTGMLSDPPNLILNAIANLKSEDLSTNANPIKNIINGILQDDFLPKKFARPSPSSDRLFSAHYDHRGGDSLCGQCDPVMVVERDFRPDNQSHVHYGLIASSNKFIKNGLARETLSRANGILCFETEAAGLTDELPSLVIRGICDYSDSHKNEIWQPYAALAAAAFAKNLLLHLPPREIPRSLQVPERNVSFPLAEGAAFGSYVDQYEPECLPGTRVDLLEQIMQWADDVPAKHIFWLVGVAGIGKSTISRTVARNLREDGRLAASFFFRRGEKDTGDAAKFFTTLARQLAKSIRDIAPSVQSAMDAEPRIPDMGLREQFNKLIFEPLSQLRFSSAPKIKAVVLIDALDECDHEEDIKLIISELVRLKEIKAVEMRIFLTSRPALPVLLGFREPSGSIYQDIVLQDIEQPGEAASDQEQAGYPIKPPEVPMANQIMEEADIISVFRPATDQSLTETNSTSLTGHNLEHDDVSTVYSDASSVDILAKEAYISKLTDELADALHKEVQSKCTTSQAVERIVEILPELLKAYALRVGYNEYSQIYREIMVFIHKNRKDIARHFGTRSVPDKDDVEDQMRSHDNMPLDEIMSGWNGRLDEEQDLNELPAEPPMEMETMDSSDGGQENLSPNLLQIYRDVIFETPAYQWLVGKLYRESLLDTTESDTMELVRRVICENLPSSRRISKRRSAEAFKVLFAIDLDLLSFINEQGYGKESDSIVEDIITLTGSADDAQALTTLKYMRQTWPFSGEAVIQLIKNAFNSFIEGEPQNFHIGHLPDKTAITVEIQDAVFFVEVLGTRDSIAEIGEQLAWLSASLRSSQLEVGVSCCTPFISEIYPVDYLHTENAPSGISEFVCKLGFSLESKENQNVSPYNGRCWHAMFRNPIVVQGFPIPRKRKRNTGLEIPLNIMASLVPTTRANVFNEKVYIKGFSAMLIPIEQEDGVIIWHFIYNSDGERISYVGSCIPHDQTITLSALETARHIVGWCAKADYYAGALNAAYDIGSSQLPEIPRDRGHVFDSIRIKRGKLITGGSKFILGEKEKPLRVSRMGKDNRPALKWIRTKYVVLWDEEDKRGWLVNGTSALLHLLRTSLVYESTDEDFSFEVCLDMNSMQEAPQTHHPSSAANFLRNPHNMNQKIYSTSEGFYFVKDRFEEIFDLLEKIIDHQEDVNKDGVEWASKPRRYLEGWDFYDLATSEDPINPRVATIKPMGKGWVDFIRAIRAIILFGCGFGEIIKPADSTGMCARWASLPKEKYYIAADICDLRCLMRVRESQTMRAMPMKIPNSDLIWHTPKSDLANCKCAESEHEIHSDFTQVFLPSEFSDLLPKTILTRWNNTGAVVFGHNSSSEWIWKDTGYPQKGELASSTEEIENESWDSGIDFESDNSFQYDDYTIGILCALPKELWAVRALFDKTHRESYTMTGDPNCYATGCFEGHNVVAACLPSGEYGTIAAARTLPNMIRTFTRLKYCFLVGIGAGIPSKEYDIRLGDVVVSQPTGIYSGVIQYDLGKDLDGDIFERVGSLQRPPTHLLNAISILRSNPNLPRFPLESYIQKITLSDWESKYIYPGIEKDQLLKACWDDSDHIKCIRCEVRGQNYIKLHYGLIASGNKVIKNTKTRDKLSDQYNALCIEMEAAGVMNTFPCVVIRGICDYADSEKNDIWQEYASATAAAYLKLLLKFVQLDAVQEDLSSRKRALAWETAYKSHAKRQQRW